MGEGRDPRYPQERNERQLRLPEGERIGGLRALPTQKVIEKHDAYVNEARSSNKVGDRLRWLERAQVYADELARREAERQGERMASLTKSMVEQGERMESLTGSINSLTVVIALATIAVGILTAWAVLSS